jgi:hypothetical protein
MTKNCINCINSSIQESPDGQYVADISATNKTNLSATITWWNLLTEAKKYVAEKQKETGNKNLTYIPNPHEKRYAIPRFQESEQTAEEAFLLIKKLVSIKLSKMGESKYWKDCVINLMDAYNYQAKIQNTYNQLKPHEKETELQYVADNPYVADISATPITWATFITKHTQYKTITPIHETDTELHFTEELSEAKQKIITHYTGKIVKQYVADISSTDLSATRGKNNEL